MSGNAAQKQKLLILRRLLEEESDQEHPLSMAQLLARLAQEGVLAERKSVYQDLEQLRLAGMDVQYQRPGGYFLGERHFQQAELKLLADAVQSARFITPRKSRELIGKLAALTSVHLGRQLRRQVSISGRPKTGNEGIYYNIDRLHDAVDAGCQISFRYFDWDISGRRAYRRDGARYQVSPHALVWDSESYYLAAFAEDSRDVRHYRIDRMEDIRLLKAARHGQEHFSPDALSRYAACHFGMFTGRRERVTLRCCNHMANVMIDRFGAEQLRIPDGPDHFTLTAEVAVSPQFFGWVCGLAGGAEILGPPAVCDAWAQLLAQLSHPRKGRMEE